MTTIKPARPEHAEAVRALLKRAGLPVEGVGTPGVELLVARADGGIVLGAIGMERRGDVALLRSLVVDAAHRGRGLGARLCDALLERAARCGVRELWLLTETAEAFFRDRGFEAAPREAAPASMQETDEFARLCPGSATAMRRALP